MRTTVVLLMIVLMTTASAASAQVSYDRKAGSLSVTYHGAPLREVLAEISKKTGIVVYIDPAVDKMVFIEKKKRPVDEVLNEIIAPLNNMLIYQGDAVVAVKIYEQVPADAMQIVSPAQAQQQNAARAAQPDSVNVEPQRTEQEKPRAGTANRFDQRRAERAKRRQAAPANTGAGELD